MSVALIYSLLPMMDGKLTLGGAFTLIGGATRTNLGRLNTEGESDQDLRVNNTGTQIDWIFIGDAPNFNYAVFEQSSDGVNYSSLGQATRVSGGWRMTGLSLQPLVNFYVRAAYTPAAPTTVPAQSPSPSARRI